MDQIDYLPTGQTDAHIYLEGTFAMAAGSTQQHAELVARAVCGAYLMVAFADGEYDKREQVRLLSGLVADDTPAGVDQESLRATLPAVEAEFRTGYGNAVARALENIASVRDLAFARKAVMQAARIAVVANQEISAQEELALGRISEILGLGKGEL